MTCTSMPLGFHVEITPGFIGTRWKTPSHPTNQGDNLSWRLVYCPSVQCFLTGMPQCGDCSLCSAALVAGLGEKPILRHLQLSWLSSAIVGRDCLQKPGRTLTWNLTITPDAQKTLSTVGQEPHRKFPVSSKSRSLGIPDPEIVGLPVPSLSTGG